MMKKFFKTVDEWMQSNPSNEVTEQVLTVINRNAVRELKQDVREKESQLRKAERLLKSTKDLGLDVSTTQSFIDNLTKEIEEMKKDLPVQVKKEKPDKKEKSKK